MADTKKIAGDFRQLVEANERALNHLSNIRLVFSRYETEPWKSKVGRITKEYDACVRAVNDMEKNYSALDGAYDIKPKIQEAETRGVESVLMLESFLGGIANVNTKEKALNDLYEKVEKLNIINQKKTNETKTGEDNFDKVTTMHDCIRYLHQKAIDNTFYNLLTNEQKIDEFYKKPIEIGYLNFATLNILDTSQEKQNIHSLKALDEKKPIRNQTKGKSLADKLKINLEGVAKYFHKKEPVNNQEKQSDNLALLAIYESYYENSEKGKRGSGGVVNIIADENSILSQILLGAHSLKLESRIGKQDSFISIDYYDTDCSYSQERMAYLQLVLDKMGYCVERNGQNLKASLYNKSEKHAYNTLKETTRLLISSKDLDLTGQMEGRTYEAAHRFLNGETNIEEAIENEKKKEEKKYKEFVDNFTYDWDDTKKANEGGEAKE